MKHLVYCLLRAAPSARAPAGVDGHDVHILADSGLAAAYSHVGDACAPPSVARITAYARVVEALHEVCTVLPVRYGCMLDTEAQVARLLRERHAEFLAALDAVDGCSEMGIRVLLRGAGGPALDSSSPTPQALSGGAYLAGRRAYYAERDGRDEEAAAVAARAQGALDGLFVELRAERQVENGGCLLLLHFLVPRSSVEPFREAFGSLRSQSPEKVVLTGPWPPYNFGPCQKALREPLAPRSREASPLYGTASIEASRRSPLRCTTAPGPARPNSLRLASM